MQTQMTLDLGIEEKVDVRSLIVHGDIEREPRRAKRAQPEPSWERVLSDGADCAFRRRCGSRSQMLVLLVTQGQYYVADERTGSRHQLTSVRALGNLMNQSAHALNSIAKAVREAGVNSLDLTEALESVAYGLAEVKADAEEVRRHAAELTGMPVVLGE